MTQMNLSVKRKQNRTETDIENGLVVAKGEGVGGEMEREVGVSRCKLLYLGWINSKVLLHSTGNYIQYPMINRNGKEYLKYVYIYITESLCCTAVINTTFKSTILPKKKKVKHASIYSPMGLHAYTSLVTILRCPLGSNPQIWGSR